MGVEQHAEAAARLVVAANKHRPGIIEAQVFLHQHLLMPHMQAAIDEATAPLRARIAALEGLGPLIQQYGVAKWSQGYEIPTEEHGSSNQWVKKTLAEITAILTGGAP